jgi:hypothetical protein
MFKAYHCPECNIEKTEEEMMPSTDITVTTSDFNGEFERVQLIELAKFDIKDLIHRECDGCGKLVYYRPSNSWRSDTMDYNALENEQEEMEKNSSFIKIPEGKIKILTVKDYIKTTDKQILGKLVEFKNRIETKEGTLEKGLGYCYILYDTEDREMIVNTFALHRQLMQVFLENKGQKNLKLEISHPKKGKWEVKLVK